LWPTAISEGPCRCGTGQASSGGGFARRSRCLLHSGKDISESPPG
jgi:hypothetical protein